MNYAQPKELCQLKEILATWEGPCRFVAGCTDFLAQRNGKPWREENLISLTELQALRQLGPRRGPCISAPCAPMGRLRRRT